jgi:flagellar protein FlgJ
MSPTSVVAGSTISATAYRLFTDRPENDENPPDPEPSMQTDPLPNLPHLPDPLTGRKAALLVQARALEAGFLAEMLNHAGLRGGEGAFAGGAGEAQFDSFLRQEQAQLLVDAGGIGLAQQIFDSLLRRGAIPEGSDAQD